MMAHFKRWTSGLVSRVDSIVVQIENQEALVDSAIADLSRRVARARVDLTRVQRDDQSLRRRLDEVTRDATLWRDRARTEADKGRALECLRRARQAARRQVELEQGVREHHESERRLRRDVATVQHKLDQLREQRNTMRTRQTRAEALAMLQTLQGEAGYQVEQVFDRWHARIAETEVIAGCTGAEYDPFVEQFEREEETAELEAELEQLRKEGDS